MLPVQKLLDSKLNESLLRVTFVPHHTVQFVISKKCEISAKKIIVTNKVDYK